MGKPDYVGGAAMSKLTELYACLYVKEFPAQALLRLRPELNEKPCVADGVQRRYGHKRDPGPLGTS